MGVGSVTRDEPVLLERGPQLATLHAAWDAVRSGRGGIPVLLAGEAGSGKTTLLRRFRTECRPPGAVLWGACVPLFTPRPLGPFADLSGQVSELGPLLAGGAKPHQVAEAIAEHARAAARQDTVVVLEDLHWADEATPGACTSSRTAPGPGSTSATGTKRPRTPHTCCGTRDPCRCCGSSG